MIINWECLAEMDKLIEEWVKVDLLLTDIPYWEVTKNWADRAKYWGQLI